MYEAFWFLLNTVVAVPIALILLGLARECVRALLALALGFRVFEFRWGSGQRLWARSIGPLEFVLARMPLAGSIIAESGSPKHHALARLLQAAGPLAFQILGAIWWASIEPWSSEPLRSGYTPATSFAIANLILIALHTLIPLETRSGFQTDIRSILDILFGRAETNRQARASYYARYARHWLERAQVERAASMLKQGLTQLGRDALLVDCDEKFQADDLSSVVDQIACADALRKLILLAEPRRRDRRGTWSRPERVRQTVLTSIPLVFAILALGVNQSEPLLLLLHERMITTSDAIALDQDPVECETQIARWDRWSPRFDRVLPDSPALNRDRHDRRARLEQCRGRADAAAARRDQAIFAAERALAELARSPGTDSADRLESEIRLTTLLRHAAELDADRSRYRLALVTLGRATTALKRAEAQMKTEIDPGARVDADELFAHEKDRLELARHAILDRMGAR